MAEVLQEMTATNVRPDLITPGTSGASLALSEV